MLSGIPRFSGPRETLHLGRFLLRHRDVGSRSSSRWALGAPRPALSLLTGLVLFIPEPGCGQSGIHVVSGRVIQEGEPHGIPGATVSLGPDFVSLSGPSGGFRFPRVPDGRHTLRVEAMGYRSRAIPLVIHSDTTLLVELQVEPIPLDSLLVRGGSVNVRGRVLDGVTGGSVPQAWVRTPFSSEVYTRSDGSFRLKGVPRGYPAPIDIGAYRYLPRSDTLLAHGDTTLSITLSPDSLAVKMFERAAEQMDIRARRVSLSQVQLSRDLIERRIYHSLGELIRTKTGRRVSTECLFIDEVRQPFVEVLDTYFASEIERIEIFGRGRMIRIYTQDFVARNLTKVGGLPPVVYVMPGVCF